MTQEDVRRLLDELGGEATIEDLATQAEKNFPERSLHTYVGQLLERLENKRLVTRSESDVWKLTKKGERTSIDGVIISEINTEVDKNELNKQGLEVTNIVGTIQTDREFDLNILANDLSEAQYHPENSPFLIYRPVESATLLVPTNGLISIVGAKTVSQMKKAVRSFVEETGGLGIEISISPNKILIQNVVVKGDLHIELDLEMLSVGIGLEKCEYNPEQFPGVIYRSERGPTILIFRTGKYLITGAKSYANTLQVAIDMNQELQGIGIDLPE